MEEIFDNYQDAMSECKEICEAQHELVRDDYLFYNGSAEVFNVNVGSPRKQYYVNLNWCKPLVDAVAGQFRQTRRQCEYMPPLISDDETEFLAQAITSAYDKLRNACNATMMESEMDTDLLVTGLSFIENSISMKNNPEGALDKELVPQEQVYYDPYHTKPNMIDARYMIRKKPMKPKDAMRMFKGTEAGDFEAFNMLGFNESVQPLDKPAYFEKNNKFAQKPDYVAVVMYQYKELKTEYKFKNPMMMIDPVLGDMMVETLQSLKDRIEQRMKDDPHYERGYQAEFDIGSEYLIVEEADFDMVLEELSVYGEPEYDTIDRDCYYTAWIGAERTLKWYKSIDQTGYTLKAKTGYKDRDKNVYRGMIAQLREMSLYINKLMTSMIKAASRKGRLRVAYNPKAVGNVQDFENRVNLDLAALPVNDVANSFRELVDSNPSTGFETVIPMLVALLPKMVGLNDEMLGMASNAQATGVLERQRINQSQSVLGKYIDAISLYQTEDAREMLEFIRYLVEVNDDLAVAVAGVDGRKEVVRLTKDIVEIDYLVDIAEAPLSVGMREMRAQFVLNVCDKVATITGNPAVYVEALRYAQDMGVEAGDVKRFENIITPEPTPEEQQMQMQAQQMEQQKAEAMFSTELEKRMAEIENKQADTQKKLAEINKVAADTDKTGEEAVQIAMETQLASSALRGVGDVRVVL